MPVALDDFVFGELRARNAALGMRLGDLVIADFRGVERSRKRFNDAFDRLARDVTAEV